MPRQLLLLFWFLGLLAAPVVAQDACIPAQGTPLMIGAVFPPPRLTGSAAEDAFHGVEAAIDAINACGGVGGQPVELWSVPAANREDAEAAVTALSGQVPLVIGSGAGVVSETLAAAASEDTFFYWELTEPLDRPHTYARSPRPNNQQLGTAGAAFAETEVRSLLGDSPRVAIVYKDVPQAVFIADGVRDTLTEPPLIDAVFTGKRHETYALAIQMREQEIDTLFVIALEPDTDQLWRAMLQADANVDAWIQLGTDSYTRSYCPYTDDILVVSEIGEVSPAARTSFSGEWYERYQTAYQARFNQPSNARADLSASGLLLLLGDVLETAPAPLSPAVISERVVLQPTSPGFMNEVWQLDPVTGANLGAVSLVSQRQDDALCTLSPGSLATCQNPLQSFPTWRERVRGTHC